jgi:exodeoxyribonuclease V gamma subunit
MAQSIQLIHHPSQEALVDQLITHISQESRSLFSSSTVVTHSQGMASYLRQCIAKVKGVCSHINFHLPSNFIKTYHTPLLKENEFFIDRGTLCFAIYALLGKTDHSETPIISTILSGSPHAQKHYSLAYQLADLFDSYINTRADLLHAWESEPAYQKDPVERCQAILWKQLRQSFPLMRTWSDLIPRVVSLNADRPISNKALHIFGVTNLPPIYIDLLHAISVHQEVIIYWQNPVYLAEGYWGDALSSKQWTLQSHNPDLDYLDSPLLANFGRLGREFVSNLYTGTSSNYEVDNTQLQSELPLASSQLEHLQQDIHCNSYQASLPQCDGSISINACYSPLREVEALHQFLIAHLIKNPTCDVSHIIVQVPNIENYAGAIDAVFGSIPTDLPEHIPYRICDRTSINESPVISALLFFLNLREKRCTSREIFRILCTEAVAREFQLAEDGLNELRTLIERSGIRWGLNQDHLKDLSSVQVPQFYTWQEGIQRLFLGYCIHVDEDPELWNETLISSDVEIDHLSLLNSLERFITKTIELRQILFTDRSAIEWIDLCHWILGSFFLLEASEESMIKRNLEEAFEVISKATERTGLNETLPVDIFRNHLESTLARQSSATGFLSGAVTFCELKPMRSIPNKVVCLLGLNYGEFPRSSSLSMMDMKRKRPRIGDRTAREDDNYTFLESILSAREHLYLSYVGQSEKTNEKLAPSVPLRILLERYPILMESLIYHPLRRYHPDYFSHDAMRSFDIQSLKIAEHISEQTSRLKTRPSIELPEMASQESLPYFSTVISIQEFIATFRRPCNSFLKERIGARLPWIESSAEEQETFDPSNLRKFILRQQLAMLKKSDKVAVAVTKAFLQADKIPYGEEGKQLIAQLEEEIRMLGTIPNLEKKQINLTFNDICFIGEFDIIQGQNTCCDVLYKTKLGPVERVEAMIKRTLLACSSKAAGYSEIYFINKTGTPQSKRTSYEQAKDDLALLLDLYRQIQLNPSLYLPKSSDQYGTALQSAKTNDKAIENAYKEWYGDYQILGESKNLIHLLFFDYYAPHSMEFYQFAKKLYSIEI